MKLELFNKKENNYLILIEGEIGEGKDVDGYQVAREIRYVDSQKPDKIIIAINSIGGDPIQTYSIITAMYNSKSVIETMNIGVAYSSAGWILASGTKGHRKAKSYTSSMIHNAMSNHERLAEVQTNSIKAILSDITGNSIEDVGNAMSKETFYEGSEQKDAGIVDEIVDSTREPIRTSNKYELMNLYKKKDIQTNTIKMDKVANKLGLDSKASESEILLKIGEVENAHGLEIQALKTENSELVTKVTNLEKTAKEVDAKTIEATFNKACEEGKYKKEDKESIILLANKLGAEGFNTMVSSMAIPHVDVNNLITGSDGNKKKVENKKEKYEDYSVQELKELKVSNNAKYEEVINEFQDR